MSTSDRPSIREALLAAGQKVIQKEIDGAHFLTDKNVAAHLRHLNTIAPGLARDLAVVADYHHAARHSIKAMPFRASVAYPDESRPLGHFGPDDPGGPLYRQIDKAVDTLEAQKITSDLQARMAESDRPSENFARNNAPDRPPSLHESIEAAATVIAPQVMQSNE